MAYSSAAWLINENVIVLVSYYVATPLATCILAAIFKTINVSSIIMYYN